MAALQFLEDLYWFFTLGVVDINCAIFLRFDHWHTWEDYYSDSPAKFRDSFKWSNIRAGFVSPSDWKWLAGYRIQRMRDQLVTLFSLNRRTSEYSFIYCTKK